jgi:serine/threonine protein kinase
MAKQPQVFESALETYEAIELIGEGGSGRVYKVQSTDGKNFAIKCLAPEKLTSEKIKRFKNELAFCRKSPHKNIVSVLDDGFILNGGKKAPFYVMPLYQKTLQKNLDEGIAPHRILAFFANILDGVEAAHIKGVWHRDLKPANILIEEDGNGLVIADWGVAHFEEEQMQTLHDTKAGQRLGNFAYSAPEQRYPDNDVNHLADIYALGVILNGMFTKQILQGAGYVTIESVSPGFSYLDSIVAKMVQQRPQSRYQSVAEIKDDLIARGAEFVSRQKLDVLKETVIPVSQVDDPLVADPPRLIERDYKNGNLILKLSRVPNHQWVELFRSQGGNLQFIFGKEPRRWNYNNNGSFSIDAEARQVQELINHCKNYVERANQLYKNHQQEQLRQSEYAKDQELKKAIAAEELRLKVLRETSI